MITRLACLSFLLSFIFISCLTALSQVTQVGSGSFTTSFPGTDGAGRNAVPPAAPRVSGVAATRPIPTNDWWTGLLTTTNANLYNYPLSMRASNNGLLISHTNQAHGANDTRQPISDQQPIVVSVTGLNAVPTVADHTDWTVTVAWANDGRLLNATTGVGMPFVYFRKGATDIASITINMGTATVSNETIVVTNSINGTNFAIYGPSGSTWSRTGNTFTSNLNGQSYFSIALLPEGVPAATAANEFRRFAYVFPVNTTVQWHFDNNTSIVRTTFTVTPEIKEGSGTTVLLGLLPHHWSRLAQDSPSPGHFTYNTVRGTMRMLASNSFAVENTFRGVLPSLPNTAKYSPGFDPGQLLTKINQVRNDILNEWTDSYNDGLLMNRLVQVAHIAHQHGHTGARDQIINTVRARLEDWLSAEPGERAFILYHHQRWSSLIPYPAGHFADANLNDHHFHYGYFIGAAAAVEQYQPGWASNWGGMVNLLVENSANWDRSSTRYPFLRTFNPYAGHSWASGLLLNAPHGNNQESSSEAMNFNAALIHWGSVTGNNPVRDLGIYLYTTEKSAIEEYYFDIHNRNFPQTYAHPIIARLWGNGIDRNTWWTPEIAAMYGIQMVPITASSFYLAHHPTYVNTLWNEMTTRTGVLQNVQNDNLWYDVYWSYLALIDPERAINLYNNFTNRRIKFGESDANTYNWIHALNGAGRFDPSVTANHPLAMVFTKSGTRTHVAHNYSDTPLTVNFSDGFTMAVPPRSTSTSRDIDASATLAASSLHTPRDGTVTLTANVSGTANRVEFFNGTTLIASYNSAPFSITTPGLPAGRHNFHVRVFNGTNFNVSNVVQVISGDQVPFGGTPWIIPGSIEAGNYDAFEGGVGQDIAYHDTNQINEAGMFRAPEGVDAAITPGEGATVGWIEAGEWLEYTVNVTTPGNYTLTFRYASGNASGGGPFRIELNGNPIASNITVPFTGSGWNVWRTATLEGIFLPAGTHVLRYLFERGGLNLGRSTFTLPGLNIPVTGVNLMPAAFAMTQGGQQQINATLIPANATNINITWSSSNPNVATVSNSGIVSAIAPGSTTITALTQDGNHAATSNVTVNQPGEPLPGGCTITAVNGDFRVEVSNEASNPTLTFIPVAQNAGATVCILYYSTTPGVTFPGFNVRPNEPFRVTAPAGSTLYFYYTYSTNTGERTTIDNRKSFTVGNCGATPVGITLPNNQILNAYPVPMKDILNVEHGITRYTRLKITDATGKIIINQPVSNTENVTSIYVGHLHPGFYILKLTGENQTSIKKLVK